MVSSHSSQQQEITYFIADLHLAQNRPDITACFLRFLKHDAVQAQTLYILGDLFEAWIGDDDDSDDESSVPETVCERRLLFLDQLVEYDSKLVDAKMTGTTPIKPSSL